VQYSISPAQAVAKASNAKLRWRAHKASIDSPSASQPSRCCENNATTALRSTQSRSPLPTAPQKALTSAGSTTR